MKYVIEGAEYPSVTTILGLLDKSDALIGWATKCMQDYILTKKDEYEDFETLIKEARYKFREASQDAMDVGSEVHRLIEEYIKDGKDPIGKMDERVENGFLAFLEWEKQYKPEWLASEKKVYSIEYGYAGTIDAIARINNKIYVIDFKSSKAIYDEYEFQLAAYLYAENEDKEESNSYKSECFGILRLDKETGLPEWKDYAEVKGGFVPFYDKKIRAFFALVQFYYLAKNRRLKDNPYIENMTKKLVEVC